ncbi:MAG: C39 family peptidase [Planctomycetes bacterium]|nr:C39 family peptidase [Planctomycetota bacterium]
MQYRAVAFAVLAVVAIAMVAAGIGTSAVGGPGTKGETNNPKAVEPAGHARPPRYASVLIDGVPHVRQKPDFCGEACVAMCLGKLGQPGDQDHVFDQSGLDPMGARGCHTKELAAALANIGFRAGPVWHKIPAAEASESLETLWKELHADLAAGVPSIVCTRYDERPKTTEHFRLILGYDADSDDVIFHEPAERNGAYRRMRRATFLSLWPLRYDARQWTVIRLRLEPGRLKRGATATTFTAADYAQHMMKLEPKVPKEGFSIVIEPPFVVIGDESPAAVRRRAEGTIRWAVDKLKAGYFEKDPAEILDIWLFKDKASYEKHVREIFHTQPTTPFGYYSDTERALVMNIHTGGGTLVHEIVHPFVAANFPECPAWLNEGLGSLYEQCKEVDGRIEGLTNWRLTGWRPEDRGLQDAIRDGRVPSFKTLCSTTNHQFYGEDPGTNYSQARYLCYYLEQHRLLRKFYHRFRANCDEDPTGYNTLKEILGRDRMEAFKKDWEAYVLKLRF